jgi:hypothetical protein
MSCVAYEPQVIHIKLWVKYGRSHNTYDFYLGWNGIACKVCDHLVTLIMCVLELNNPAGVDNKTLKQVMLPSSVFIITAFRLAFVTEQVKLNNPTSSNCISSLVMGFCFTYQCVCMSHHSPLFPVTQPCNPLVVREGRVIGLSLLKLTCDPCISRAKLSSGML